MASVVFLRGVNVGGHRTFRPSVLARALRHLDAVNVGAAGTFVIRQSIGRTNLRSEFARRLPFDAEIIICHGHELARLCARDPFAAYPPRQDLVRFVSVLARLPALRPPPPFDLPPGTQWLVRVLERQDRFVVGLYRRQMKAIGCLGTLDRVFGVLATTRSWSTMAKVVRVLGDAI